MQAETQGLFDSVRHAHIESGWHVPTLRGCLLLACQLVLFQPLQDSLLDAGAVVRAVVAGAGLQPVQAAMFLRHADVHGLFGVTPVCCRW
jgi:hypothetical protein